MNESKVESIGKTELPLIRLSLAIPVVEEVERRGIILHDLLEELSLSRDAIYSQELFVPAPVMYSLLEALAQAADDPCLLVTIGETLDLTTWPVFSRAVAGAFTIGDFFNRFTIEARAHATSICYELTTDGAYALFKARRAFIPNMVPAQADAFYAGLIINIFRHAMHGNWDARQLTMTVCDLRAIPRHYQGIRLQQGDKSGASIRFPMEFLLLPFSQESTTNKWQDAINTPPNTLINAIRESLRPYLHLPDLSVAKAAEICGFKERILRSRLHDLGTSLGQEIALLREQKAVQLLLETNSSIADIGNEVGICDSSSFTRSFKRWTGMTPKEYRLTHRA